MAALSALPINIAQQLKETSTFLPGVSPKNVMSDIGQRGRLVHNEQFAPFYGSVVFENAPNLHAGSRQT
jgi:hypothetical protein